MARWNGILTQSIKILEALFIAFIPDSKKETNMVQKKKKKVFGQMWGVGKEMKVKQGQYDSEWKKGGKYKEPAAITKCYIKKNWKWEGEVWVFY